MTYTSTVGDRTPGGRFANAPPPVVAGAVLTIACLTALTLVAELQGAAVERAFLDVAVGVTACALIPVLLRRPVPTATTLAVLAAISPAATPAATVGTLQTARERPLRQAAPVAAVGVVGHLVRELWRTSHDLPFGWWALFVVIAHAALLGWGGLARARCEVLVSLWDRAERAEADQAARVHEARMAERRRIAREMHDVLAHRLSLLVTTAGALEYRSDLAPERIVTAAAAVRAGAHQALDDLREVIGVLRYDDLDASDDDVPGGRNGRAGLPAGGARRPQPVLADVARLIDEVRSAGVEVRLDHRVACPEDVPDAAARTVYRVVQEGLTNARRHAPGQPVAVTIGGGAADGLALEVVNPLPPPGVRPSTTGSSTGLVGLAERIDIAGGRLEHGIVGDTFVLRAWLPWPA